MPRRPPRFARLVAAAGLTRVATNLVAEIIGHRAPATNLPFAHAVPREEVNTDPDPVNGDQGKHGHKSIYQGWVQVGTPR
jgi:hypothetical protein